MTFEVFTLDSAEGDLADLMAYLRAKEGDAVAQKIYDGISGVITSLDNAPGRGHTPPDILGATSEEIREVHFKPYRIIYQIDGNKVFVHIVADGRRDIKSLLSRRLLRN